MMLIPVHDAQHLLANVLSSLQGASLDEVLEAPWVRELIVLPGVIDGQQREVIPLQLEELGLLLVSERLFVLRTKQKLKPLHGAACNAFLLCETTLVNLIS